MNLIAGVILKEMCVHGQERIPILLCYKGWILALGNHAMIGESWSKRWHGVRSPGSRMDNLRISQVFMGLFCTARTKSESVLLRAVEVG